MRHRNHFLRLKLRCIWAIGAGLSLLLVLCLSLAPRASSATSLTGGASVVVPATGTVAGKGYPYWLERAFLLDFTNPHNPPCMTVSVGGVGVALLDGLGVKPGSWTCNEPAGRAIYVGEPAYECSTLSGDHVGYGTTPADLEKCAKANWDAGTEGVSFSEQLLDGHSIDLRELVTATGEFYVPKVTAGSFMCRALGLGTHACAPTTHSAAIGTGLLLRDLPKGTHILHFIANGVFGSGGCGTQQNAAGGCLGNNTYTLHVS